MQLGKAITSYYHTLLDNDSTHAAGDLVAEVVDQNLDQVGEMRVLFSDDLLAACNQQRDARDTVEDTGDGDSIDIEIAGRTYRVMKWVGGLPCVFNATTLVHDGHVDDDDEGVEYTLNFEDGVVAITAIPLEE